MRGSSLNSGPFLGGPFEKGAATILLGDPNTGPQFRELLSCPHVMLC